MIRLALKAFIFLCKLFVRLLWLPFRALKYIKWAIIPAIGVVIYKLIGKSSNKGTPANEG